MAFKKKNLIGEVFGSLLVQELTDEKHPLNGERVWKCLCICGNRCRFSTGRLVKGDPMKKSCGCGTPPKVHKNRKYPSFSPLLVERYRRRKFVDKSVPDDPKVRWRVLEKYAVKGWSVEEIAKEFDINLDKVQRFITEFRHKLNQTYELNYLINIEKVTVSQTKIDKVLSRRFTEEELKAVTSPPNSERLTDEEMLYAHILEDTGSSDQALVESGLVDALKIKDTVRKRLLGIYIKEKPNVAAYIKALKNRQVEEVDISKEFVQSELVNQIEQLKNLVQEQPNQRGVLLQALKLVGQTIGAYQDTVKVETIDAAKALDELVELTKLPSDKANYQIIEDVKH